MGGAAGCQWRWWQRWGGLEGMGRRCEREIAPYAQRSRSRASWAGRRGEGVGIGVSGHLPVRVTARRNEDTRQGTASGNYRSGDIVARPRRDPPPRRQLDRPVPSARSTPPRDWISSAVARCRRASPGSEQPGTIGLVSLRGVPEPVVSDLVKASRHARRRKRRRNSTPGSRSMRHASAPRSFQRKVTGVWSMPRIRALLMAVRKTYRDR